MKIVIGFLICLAIGIACKRFGIPLPGPISFVGVAMIAALWFGYTIS
jgi:hypothetical protein